jgi:hypothetical protein
VTLNDVMSSGFRRKLFRNPPPKRNKYIILQKKTKADSANKIPGFHVTSAMLRPRCFLSAESACKAREYQGYLLGCKGGRCVGLTSLPSSCYSYEENWQSEPPGAQGTIQACTGNCCTWTFSLVMFYFFVLLSTPISPEMSDLFAFFTAIFCACFCSHCPPPRTWCMSRWLFSLWLGNLINIL